MVSITVNAYLTDVIGAGVTGGLAALGPLAVVVDL